MGRGRALRGTATHLHRDEAWRLEADEVGGGGSREGEGGEGAQRHAHAPASRYCTARGRLGHSEGGWRVVGGTATHLHRDAAQLWAGERPIQQAHGAGPGGAGGLRGT